VIAVDASKPIKSIPDLISHLKNKPQNGFYGTGSNTGQVAAELFKVRVGVDTTYVPFKATITALAAVLSALLIEPKAQEADVVELELTPVEEAA